MKKLLSILLAASLMTASLGTISTQVSAATQLSSGAVADESVSGVTSQATVELVIKQASYTDNTGLTFTVSDESSGKITVSTPGSNLTSSNNMLVIPSQDSSSKTTKIISANTFDGLDGKDPQFIKTLVIPDTIEQVESNALSKLSGLTNIIILKSSQNVITGLGDNSHGANSAKVRYQDQMPTVQLVSIEDENPDLPGYTKKVTLEGKSTVAETSVTLYDSGSSTLSDNQVTLSNTSKTTSVVAKDADGFESSYDVEIKNLGKPVVEKEAVEVKLTKEELQSVTASVIIEKSGLVVKDADTKNVIEPKIEDSEIDSVKLLTDNSSFVQVTATCTSDTSESRSDSITVSLIKEVVDNPEGDVITKEVLNALITKSEGLVESEYTSDTYSVLKIAIEAAKKITLDENSTNEQIKSAYDTLMKAINGLRKPVATGEITTESGNTVKAEEIPTVSEDYIKVQSAVSSIDSTVSGAEKFDLQNAQILKVLDLTVENASANGETVKLTLAKLTDGKKYVLAHYNAQTGKIDAIYEGVDNGDGTFSFAGITSFSPFALMSVSAVSSSIDSSNPSTPNTTNPSTGDTTAIALVLTLTVASATGAYVVRKKLVK